MNIQQPALPLIHHTELDPAWLARHTEEILEPELTIIDPHHHLWDRSGGYFLDELLADLNSGHKVEATVFVQCGYAYRTSGQASLRPVGESQFVAGVAAEAQRRNVATRVCAGIVGAADLKLGAAVDEVLQAHRQAAGGRFRGIRTITARDDAFNASILGRPEQGVFNDPGFREGYARLGAFDLSFDAWLYHTQIHELTALADAFPGTPIVLNHVGGPLGVGPYRGRRDEVFQAWLAQMQELARRPNAYVKLGGLGMAVMGFEFQLQPQPPSSAELAVSWRPYMENCIELFGAQRCMFESNFPVDKPVVSYHVLWNAYKRIAAGATPQEKAALFHDTAARFYRLRTGT